MKARNKGIIPVIIIFIISLAAEMLFANFPFISGIMGKDEVKDYIPDNVTEEKISEQDSSFAVAFLDFPLNSVSFTVKADYELSKDSYTTASFYISDENSTKNASLVKKERIVVGADERSYTVYLNSYGNATYLDVTFSDIRSNFTVTDIIINPTYRFSFDFLRFALIFAAMLFAYSMKKSSGFRNFRRSFGFDSASAVSASVCACAAVCVMIFSIAGDGGIYHNYPLSNGVEHYSPYIQQLDAFLKGQLHIDVQPSAELLALENPYSIGERDGIPYLFDRAFYGGKYYSYFGIAPILTIYLPVYFITGKIVSDSLVLGFFSVISSVFLPLAVVQWIKTRNKTAPWLACALAVTAYFASMVPLIQRGNAAFYYIACISGMAFVSAFIFFMLKAVNSEKQSKRTVFFALAGISFAIAFLSRLNSVLPLIPVIAVFMIIYAIKHIKSKKILPLISDAAALGIPVLLSIVFSLGYNLIRFDDPLQFGAAYQLTVANASEYEIYAGGIFPAIYHYFLQPFVTSEFFPYIQLGYTRLSDYGRYLYTDTCFGIFAIPFMLSLLLSPILLKSKKITASSKILLTVSLASFILTAFFNFCLGGIIFRYTADMLVPAAFLCAVILNELCISARESFGDKPAGAVKKGVCVLCAASILICFAVTIGINGNLSVYDPDVYLAMKDLFVIGS